MLRDNWTAVKEAASIYRHAGNVSPAWRLEAVETLASHKLWSLTQIVAISGVPMHDVRRIASKKSHTGGRFNPATLQLILELFDLTSLERTNDNLVARIVQEGTSVGMLARIIGAPVGRFRNQLERVARGQAVTT